MHSNAPKRDSRKRLVITAAIFITIGLLFGGTGYWLGDASNALANQGIETSAIVISKTKKRKYSRINSANRRLFRDTNASYDYLVKFRFEADGTKIEGKESVSKKYYTQVKPAQKINARYLRSDPSINEIEPGSRNLNAWIASGFGMFFLLAGFGFLYLAIKKKSPPMQATR